MPRKIEQKLFFAVVGALAGVAIATPARAVEPDSSVVAFQDWTVNCAKAPAVAAAKPATAAKPPTPPA